MLNIGQLKEAIRELCRGENHSYVFNNAIYHVEDHVFGFELISKKEHDKKYFLINRETGEVKPTSTDQFKKNGKKFYLRDDVDFALFSDNGQTLYFGLNGERLYTKEEFEEKKKTYRDHYLDFYLHEFFYNSFGVTNGEQFKMKMKALGVLCSHFDPRPIKVDLEDLLLDYIPMIYEKEGFKDKGWVVSDYISEDRINYWITFQDSNEDPSEGVTFLVNKRTGDYKENMTGYLTIEEINMEQTPVKLPKKSLESLRKARETRRELEKTIKEYEIKFGKKPYLGRVTECVVRPPKTLIRNMKKAIERGSELEVHETHRYVWARGHEKNKMN